MDIHVLSDREGNSYRNKWIELPVGGEVLERIKDVALQKVQPPISTNFVYEWRRATQLQNRSNSRTTISLILTRMRSD